MPSTAPTGERGRAAAIAAAVIGVLGLLLLLEPIAGDQTLAILMGRRMRDGALLYRDVWDIRQPGVYVWFAVVGWFGTSSVVVNLAHTVWHAALAALVARDVTADTGRWRSGVVVATAGVAPIFWMLRPNDTAQPDTLALLPLYLVFRVVTRPADRQLRGRELFLLGLATGGIGLIKIVYAPVPVLLVAARAVHERWSARAVVRHGGAFVAGGAAVAGATVIGAVVTDTAGWIAHTWLVQGPRMRSLSKPPLIRLVLSTGRVVVGGLPIWIAAGVALGRWWRRRDLRTTCLVLWLLAVGPAFLAQSWWSYQALALVLPVGLLGGPVLVEWMERPAVRRGAIAAVVAVMVAFHVPYIGAVADHGLDVAAIERELDPEREVADSLRTFLDGPDRLAGEVYVLGHPKLVFRSGRAERIAIHGWSTEYYDHDTWHRLGHELHDDPPAYIVAEPGAVPPLIDRAQELWAWIEDGYRVVTVLDGDIEVWECASICGQ